MCLTGRKAAFVTLIITIVDLLAYALLISFNGVFIAQPSTCILTPTCASQSVSTTGFSYTMSQKFFTAFNSLNGFKTYTLSQSKYLFQTVQISFGCLGFVLCVTYIIIYFIQSTKTGNQVIPFSNDRDSPESTFQPTKRVNASGLRRKPESQRSLYSP